MGGTLMFGDDQVPTANEDLFRKSLYKDWLTSMFGREGITAAVKAHGSIPTSFSLHLLTDLVGCDRVDFAQLFLAKEINGPLFGGGMHADVGGVGAPV